MKTTILGGILFLVPVAMLAIVIGKSFQLSMMLAEPVDQMIPIENVAGVAFVNIVALVLILVICYLAGLAARMGLMSSRLERLDGLLIDFIPGYAVTKSVIGSVAQDEDVSQVFKPVTVAFDDYSQIAFEIERNETTAILFLPGAPSAWAGSTVAVDVARVSPLDLPTHQAAKLMRKMGRGTLAAGVFASPADQ